MEVFALYQDSEDESGYSSNVKGDFFGEHKPSRMNDE